MKLKYELDSQKSYKKYKNNKTLKLKFRLSKIEFLPDKPYSNKIVFFSKNYDGNRILQRDSLQLFSSSALPP